MIFIREPKWTDDEILCARIVNNEVHFYENRDFSKSYMFQYLLYSYVHQSAGNACFKGWHNTLLPIQHLEEV